MTAVLIGRQLCRSIICVERHSITKCAYLNPVFMKQQNIHTKDTKKRFNDINFTAAGLVASCPKAFQPYLRLMRADKPTDVLGTWLILWPGLWSLSFAAGPEHVIDGQLMTLFCAGAFLMRSTGCVVNDLWDKDFDNKVERTKLRPLASGELRPIQALGLFFALSSSSLAVLLQLNWLSVALGCAIVPLVVCYPLAKRFTYFPQFILGLTLNWGAVLGFTASATDTVNLAAIGCTYFAALCWTMLYDTIYAHQDKSDDILIGVKSLALKLGDKTRPWLFAFGTGMVGGLGSTGLMLNMYWPYYLGLSATAMHLIWQVSRVKLNNNADCWNKFKSNLWLGWLIFGGILGSNYLRNREIEKQMDYWEQHYED